MLYSIEKEKIAHMSLEQVIPHMLRDYPEISHMVLTQISIDETGHASVLEGYIELNDQLLNNEIDQNIETVIVSTLKNDLELFFGKMGKKIVQDLKKMDEKGEKTLATQTINDINIF